MILLDTHAWIWWVSDLDKLSAPGRSAMEKAVTGGTLCISTISTWEVAMLVARDRLKLTMEVGEWIDRCESLAFLEFIPVNNAIALRAVSLPGEFHADPADRIIVATAQRLGATLITKDERILSYPHVDTIW